MVVELNIEIRFTNYVFKKTINYPAERSVEVVFDNADYPITVEEIKINGMGVNPYYNTRFLIAHSNTVLTSVHTLEKNGTYVLHIDDLYLRSHRSKTWHCSPQKKDFIFQYEFTRDSFVDTYRDRNHVGFDQPFTPCFGCSYTYGSYQPDTATWPYLLSKKTNKNFLNLGVAGSGMDCVYNNLTLLYQKHPFKEAVVLFPNFERRVVRVLIEDAWMRLFTSVRITDETNAFCFYSDQKLKKEWQRATDAIIRDIKNRYSKRILSRLVRFCQRNDIKLYCSSWSSDVYDHLKTLEYVHLLPKFPEINIFKERADDGGHPHHKHYQHWVDQIARVW
jgi:hypothetical protein